MNLTATIVTIGDEILIGQIVNTNATYLSKELDSLGFKINEIVSVADTQEAIRNVLSRLDGTANLILLTGGLGPTKDDVTKKVFCDFFNDELVENPEVLMHVTTLLENYYKRPISEVNKLQALVPAKAIVLKNRVGTAPGMLMKSVNTFFVCMPGVPYEMKTIFQEELIPFVKENLVKEYNIHRTIMTYGVGESLLAEFLQEWEDGLPNDVSLAYLPSPGSVRLRLSVHGTDYDLLEKKIQDLVDLLPSEVVKYVVSFQDEGIDKNIAKQLLNLRKSISFAESFTGGVLTQLFASVPGASAYFNGGVVTYATQSKIDVLGIDKMLICKEGVVSEAVAIEMARNAKRLFKSDFAVATTGNAGPTKGDSDVPIGTVFIGIATPEVVFAKEFNLGQPREKVVQEAVSKGLLMIYEEMLKNK